MVVLNFDVKNGAWKLGQSGHLFRSYDFFFSERAKWKIPLNLLSRDEFSWDSRFSFSLLDIMHRGIIWTFFGHFQTPCTPKDWFLSKKGPKEDERVARGHFHEYNGYLQALDLPQYLLPFPGTGHLKIPWGSTQFLFSQFYGLLKLIFHNNQYNGA